MVNRVWHHLFGVGIVPTVDNFGRAGPTAEPSGTARLSGPAVCGRRLVAEAIDSRAGPVADLSNVEPSRCRPTSKIPATCCCTECGCGGLEGEAIRDAILAVSGRLDRRQFGPSVPVYLTADLQRARPAGQQRAAGRRRAAEPLPGRAAELSVADDVGLRFADSRRRPSGGGTCRTCRPRR